jgi:hypothetical protein
LRVWEGIAAQNSIPRAAPAKQKAATGVLTKIFEHVDEYRYGAASA